MEKPIRLNKHLSSLGVGSRRNIDLFIEQGRITVDGKVATLGMQILPSQTVALDGRPLQNQSPHEDDLRVLLYHKPSNTICSRYDPEGRETVFESLPHLNASRWVAIGRLDYKTTGLLVFTNNGDLAHKMMHPSTELEREYHVKVQGACSTETINKLMRGVLLDDGWAKAENVQLLEAPQTQHTWLSVVLKEGRNREVRRLFDAVGKTVVKLSRVRYGILTLPEDLEIGSYYELDENEIKKLIESVNKKES